MGLASLLIWENARHGGVRIGDPAPLFLLPTRTGQAVNLEELRGRVVLVNFWATWCPPCLEEFPSLERLYRRLRSPDFELVAVSVDEAGWADVVRFLDRSPVGFPVVLDSQGGASDRYGVSRLPATFLIDRMGIVIRKYMGPRDWDDPRMVSEIERYVHGS